mmetsp:Transcript_48559/g.80634  ORF Transcript_48559/g.80634 Transcript_48559/m.80634 type:complete len:109 (+) Transcript_48559:247-573(+)
MCVVYVCACNRRWNGWILERAHVHSRVYACASRECAGACEVAAVCVCVCTYMHVCECMSVLVGAGVRVCVLSRMYANVRARTSMREARMVVQAWKQALAVANQQNNLG